MRHRGGAAPARRGAISGARVAAALADLAYLRLRQQRDIPGDLADRGRDPGQGGGQVDDPQPVGMPGQHGPGQAQFLSQQCHDPGAVVAERRERARRAAELHGQPLRADHGQPFPGFVQAGQPARCHQAERDGNSLLEQRPADHDRGPVRVGEPGRGGRGLGQVGQHGAAGPLGQQHRGRVHDVLAGRSPVHGTRRRLRDRPGQGPGQRGHRVAGQRRERAELADVEVPGLGRLGDRHAGTSGRQPGPLERPGQPCLGIQHGLQPRGVAGIGAAAIEDPAEQPLRSWLLMVGHVRIESSPVFGSPR